MPRKDSSRLLLFQLKSGTALAHKTPESLMELKWKKQDNLTVLLNREVLDGIPDFISLPQHIFDKCTTEELEFAFQALILAMKPLYSGSLDHRVNQIDIKKTRLFL